MALKGLTRAAAEARKALTEQDNDAAALSFIKSAPHLAPGSDSAPAKAAPKKVEGPKFRRTNFSMTDKSNKKIDQFSLLPRTFKASRSDVVRAGLLALEGMSNKEVVALLAKVVGAEEGAEET